MCPDAFRCRVRSTPITGAILLPRRHARATSSIISWAPSPIRVTVRKRLDRSMVAGAPASRLVGELTFPDVSQWLKETSILCLPIGAFEQHGAHLPLNTDVVIAEEIARRIVARWGHEFDLWLLPTISISLSREHDWAPGTLSLSIETFVALVKDLAREIVRALPARNVVIVNGHGGNRGILDNLMHELVSQLGLNVCVIHPFDLSRAPTQDTSPDVHGGKNETSVMLALAPHLVRTDLIASSAQAADQDA